MPATALASPSAKVSVKASPGLIAAARRWPQARFYGLDISEAMLTTARAKVESAGLSDRIMLVQGDAAKFDTKALFGLDGFDRVFLSYTLSMIPDWTAAIEQAAKAVAAGGALRVVDFGQQEKLPGWWRQALFAWLERFHVTPRRELPVALRHTAMAHGLELGFEPLLRGYAWSGSLRRG